MELLLLTVHKNVTKYFPLKKCWVASGHTFLLISLVKDITLAVHTTGDFLCQQQNEQIIIVPYFYRSVFLTHRFA